MRLRKAKLGEIQVSSMRVDMYEIMDFAMGKTHAESQNPQKLSVRWCPGWQSVGNCSHNLDSGRKSYGSSAVPPSKSMHWLWRMLWCSAPTCLNNNLLNHGVIHEKYKEAVSLAILATFLIFLWVTHTIDHAWEWWRGKRLHLSFDSRGSDNETASDEKWFFCQTDGTISLKTWDRNGEQR